MKKRFLPFSLLLVIMILGQSIIIADNGGHYVPRTQGTASADRFMSEMRANQHTGLIDPALMLKAAQAQNTKDNPADADLYWLSMGPDNMGGQTTAIVYDNRPDASGNWNGDVYIGSKGGGVYKTYNNGITWHQVGNKDLMVSCMTQDEDGVIYVGTGDGGTAVSHNGLSDLGYNNSFVGSGIYTIVNDEISVVSSTVPSINEVSPWSFVNGLTFVNGIMLAATNEGLLYSNDKGQSWNMLLEGVASCVKGTKDNKIVASIGGQIFIGTVDNMECHSSSNTQVQYNEDHEIIAIPKGELVDIATSTNNAGLIYASVIASNGTHTGIYFSNNSGETWEVALPAITINNINSPNVYGGYGLLNHNIVIDPANDNILYVGGYDMWMLERPADETGYFVAYQLTNGAASSIYLDNYLHVGICSLAFNPYKAKEFYVGTDGGIFKGVTAGRSVTTSNCNRNYITSRMLNVGVSGTDKHIMASGLDHGTVLIEGIEGTNSEGHATWINPSQYNNGAFSEDAIGGPCAFSQINPNTIFVTSKGGRIYRSETAGEDWISTNFTSDASGNATISLASNFRTPILLFENFDDENSIGLVWFKNTTGAQLPSGSVVKCMSENNYPFDYTLTAPLAAGDSIQVHDPITSKLYVANTNEIYMTNIPLHFNLETVWYKLSIKALGFEGIPMCMAISSDGDNLFVGTKTGGVFRLSNLNTVVDSISASNTDTVNFHVTTTALTLGEGVSQCVTSIAVDPRDANKVVVTLGNYENDSYVYYSSNALADEPVFVSKQNNLPKMPVYSSVIEMETGDVILGTERGIYRTKDINSANWVANSFPMGEVPVLELKQQISFHEDQYVVQISAEDTLVTSYQGVKNTGIIYAATYGKGIFRCENYKQVSGTSVPEMPVAEVETQVSIYPNPVSTQATVSFDVEGTSSVSYQVFDLTGRLVMKQDLGRMTEGSHEIQVNTSELSTGSYILRLTQGVRNSSVKFLVY